MTELSGGETRGRVRRDVYNLLIKLNCALIPDELEIDAPVDVYTIDPSQGELADATITAGEILSARRISAGAFWDIAIKEADPYTPGLFHTRQRVMNSLGSLVEVRSGAQELEEVGIITGRGAMERVGRMTDQAPPAEAEQSPAPQSEN